ncbi:hypothetical protein GGR51DRAFT_499061 [Nemania sp. FL0031]|nr:hypothetical protein GGR51DRAFT_499061 [Nemania sp. FL0031]
MFDDRALFRGVRGALPGHDLDVTERDGMRQVKYWDAGYEDKRKLETRTIDEMISDIRERLVELVRLRLRADVSVASIYLGVLALLLLPV